MRRKKSVQEKSSSTLDSFLKIDSTKKTRVNIEDINTKLRVPKGTAARAPVVQYTDSAFLYPKNPEIREYQYYISRTCLFYNTMVCLPTGLGKTHIASVLILNFYRWFSQGKIFFLAPTRPLVYQQRNSLTSYYDRIDEDHIIEVNGEVPIGKRKKIYSTKRIFFMTPQTLDNDLSEQRFDAGQTVLIIFDEAHRAVGNYAYTNIVRKLDTYGMGYRIVGLSATPGNCMQKIQEVIGNLRIAKIESKDDNDPDVKKYIHSKEIIPVEIAVNSMIIQVEKLLDSFLNRPINLLISMEIIGGYLVKIIRNQGINQGSYFQILDGFRKNEQHYRNRLDKREIGLAYSCLKIMRLIVDCKKALRQQGYDSFRHFLNSFKDPKNEKYNKIPFKKEILSSQEFKKLEQIFEKEQCSSNHPKLCKLKQLLTEFFTNKQNITEQSKAIVFTGFKASALEIKNFLDTIKEVRAALFVGQSKTIATTTELVEDELSEEVSVVSSVSVVQLKQKDQIQTIKQFKNYEFNTLVSTSIGEEGLDIGEVDLIICYDSGMSPIRMVQRMGRTGRKRSGKVYLLLMEGKQADKYEKATKNSQSLKRNIRSNSQQTKNGKGSKLNKLTFQPQNCVMLPQGRQLAIQYIDNKIIKKQDSPIKKPSKQNIVKEVDREQNNSDDQKEAVVNATVEHSNKSNKSSKSKISQNSDQMLDILDALENDNSVFQSL